MPENIESVINWILGNIIWSILILMIFSVIPSVIKIFQISKFLLKENRPTISNYLGKHFADRFIDIWKSSKNGMPTGEKVNYLRIFNLRHSVKCIDKEIEDRKIVVIKEGYVFPIKNIRNTVIIKILKFWLINIIGENKELYKDI